MFRFVVLPCFDLRKSYSSRVNTQLGVWRHWWLLFTVDLVFICLAYQVKLDWLPLYCLDSPQPAELPW